MLAIITIVTFPIYLSWCITVPTGNHSNYDVGSDNSGFFSCNSESNVNIDGDASIGYMSVWQVQMASSVNVENGSICEIGSTCTNPGTIGDSYSSVLYYAYSNVQLISISSHCVCTYASLTVAESTLLLENSTFRVGDYSEAVMIASRMTLDRSTIQLGLYNQFDLDQSTTINMLSSTLTTAKGAEVHMAYKATIDVKNMNINIGEHSMFSLGTGASLFTLEMPSYITIGNRAVLSITGNCVFKGKLIVPDRTMKVVNESDSTVFACFRTSSALKQFMSKGVVG